MALTTDFNVAYDRFVSAWLDYEQLRGSGDFAGLVSGKQRLAELRLEMRAAAGRSV